MELEVQRGSQRQVVGLLGVNLADCTTGRARLRRLQPEHKSVQAIGSAPHNNY